MGNLSSTIDYRSIVNEIKFGADLTLADINDENYYNYIGAANAAHPSSAGSGGGGDGSTYSPPLDASSASANPPSSPYRVTGETSITAARYFAKDRPIWRTLFLTEMTDDEVASFFNYEDIRYLRMYRPHNLAIILYKCIEQAAAFLSTQNYPDLRSGGKISNHAPSDYTAVMNAVRMLTAAFPYVFEELPNVEEHSTTYRDAVTTHPLNNPADVDGNHTAGNLNTKEGFITRDFREADAKWRKKGVSPFAAEFAHHFFFKNRVCLADDERASPSTAAARLFTECPVFPPIPIRGGGAETTTAPPPIAVVVTKVLTRLCFVPYFTVGGLQRLDSASAYFTERVRWSEDTKVGDFVFGKLLWMGGNAFGNGEQVFGFSGEEAVSRRNVVMKAIIAMLSEPFMRLTPLPTTSTPSEGSSVAAKNCMFMRFLGIFTSPRLNPLSYTLAASLVGVISHHNSRGALPFTSGIGAALPETQLALSLQLLTLSIDYYYSYGRSVTSTTAFARRDIAAELRGASTHSLEGLHHLKLRRSSNAFHLILHELAVSSPYARYIELGRGEIPQNPPPNCANFARQFVAGVVRVLENPSYALGGTVIQGSQKTISCYTEALQLLYRIVLHIPSLRDCFFVTITSSPYPSSFDSSSSTANSASSYNDDDDTPTLAPPSPLIEAGSPGTLLQSLWYFIEMGAVTYLYFSQSVTVLNILLHAFESRVFREFLQQKRFAEELDVICMSYLTSGFGVKFFAKAKSIQLSSQLPPLSTSSKTAATTSPTATFADGLALGMCYLLSAASPRWCYFTTPLVARILHNTLITAASAGKIHDTVQFELRHSVAFLCEDNFLKKGATAQDTLTTVASTVYTLLQMHCIKEESSSTSSPERFSSSSLSPENIVVLASTLSTCISFGDWLDHQTGGSSKSVNHNDEDVHEPIEGSRGEDGGDEFGAAAELSTVQTASSGSSSAALARERSKVVATKLHALFGTMSVAAGGKAGTLYNAVQKHLEDSKGKQESHGGASSPATDWDLSESELRGIFPIVMRALGESTSILAREFYAPKDVSLLLPGQSSSSSICSNWESLWATHALWRSIVALNRPIMLETSTSSISVAKEGARLQAVKAQK